MSSMTTKNAKGKPMSLVAAALAAALTAGTAVAPALAEPVAGEQQVAIVAQSCDSDYAVDEAVAATPLTYWEEVSCVDWYYDAGTDDYVVTVYSVYGTYWTAWVDATTGIVWQVV